MWRCEYTVSFTWRPEPYSKQIPGLVKASLNRKQGGVIEEGLNLWPSIHIDGVETLYTSVFDAARKGLGDTGHECEGYDLGENGEHQVGAVSEVLVELFA